MVFSFLRKRDYQITLSRIQGVSHDLLKEQQEHHQKQDKSISLSLSLSGLSSHNPFNSKLLSIWLTCLSQAPRCVSWSFPLKISAKFTSRTFINCFKEWGFGFAVDAGQLIWVQITKHKDTAISSLSFSSPYLL